MLSKGDRSGIVLGSMAVGSGGLGWIRVGILESQFQDFLWIVETVGRVKENPLRMYCTCTRDVFFFFSILLSLTKRVSCKLGGRALEPGLHTNFASIDPMCILEFLFLFLVLSVGDSVLVCHWVPRGPKNKKVRDAREESESLCHCLWRKYASVCTRTARVHVQACSKLDSP